MYILHCKALLGRLVAVAEVNAHLELWHKRLGHMSQKGLDVLTSLKRVDGQGSKLDFCNDCLFGKKVRAPYYYGVSCKSSVLELVHFDVCSMPVKWVVLHTLCHLLMIIHAKSGFIY